jgi:hypothetical protein
MLAIEACFLAKPNVLHSLPGSTLDTQHNIQTQHHIRHASVCLPDGCGGSTATTTATVAAAAAANNKTITSSTSDVGSGSSGNGKIRLFLLPWHHVSPLPSSWFLSIFKPRPSPSGTKLGLGLLLGLELGSGLG